MAGTIAAMGRGVRGWKVGDRVAVFHHIPCGTCFYCQRKDYAQCPVYKKTGSTAGFEPAGGGFAEYVRVMPWIVEGGGVTFVPDAVTLEAASFLEPVNTCLKCVRVARLRKHNAVLVVGAGAIGLILVRLSILAGADVYVSEPMADRRERAKASGAKDVADPRATDVAQWLRAATSGRGADAALVAVPGQAPLDAAIAGVRPGGRVVLFAATKLDDPVTVDAGQICFLEKDVVGAYSADADLNAEVADLVFSGRLRVDDLVSHRFDLGDAPAAFDLAKKPTAGSMKVLVTMNGTSK
jgi:L-iditol 2-dehydrogenase